MALAAPVDTAPLGPCEEGVPRLKKRRTVLLADAKGTQPSLPFLSQILPLCVCVISIPLGTLQGVERLRSKV